MSDKVFSVIIPTYNDWERLLNCIEALELQTFARDRFEVLVVNNAKAAEIPSGYSIPDLAKVLHEPVAGSYMARNFGAEMARGKILAFTDSDCLPEPGWLKNAANIFTENDCDLIGGKINLYREEDGSQIAYIFEKHTAFQQQETVPEGNSVTANLFIKKTVYERLGGFDGTMKSGGDWEFTRRAVNKGYILEYSKSVVVKHPARRSIGNIFSKQRRFAAWGLLNIKRRYGHSTPRIILSTIKGGLIQVAEAMNMKVKFHKRLLIASIQFLITVYKFLLQMGIWLRLINPNRIRE